MREKKVTLRLLSFLLSLTMLTAMLPASAAWAASAKPVGDNGGKKVSGTITVSEVNPLYADILSQQEPTESSESSESNAWTVYSSAYNVQNRTYDTLEGAAADILQNMEARNNKFSFTYISSQQPSQNMFRQMFERAIEHNGDPSGGDYMKWGFSRWNVSASYNIVNEKYQTTVTWNVGYYTNAEQEAQFCSQVTQLCQDLNLDAEYLSDYQKVKIIYDYICSNVTYDYKNLNDSTYMLKHTAYAALINKTAVCQGYAQLFYWMALHSGIDARIVPNADHGWNLVALGNQYYYVDATWDAPQKQSGFAYLYFLKGSQDFTGHSFNASTHEVIDPYAISERAYDLHAPADYTEVDQALASIPADLSPYTDESVAAVTQAKKAVVRGKTAAEQASVDAMARAINAAVAGLTFRGPDGLSDTPENGIWYYYKDGKVATDVTTVAHNSNGWFYVRNGQVDFSYTGFASNSSGWWYVQGGCVDFSVNSVLPGTVNGEDGWWHVVENNVVFDDTVAQNGNGWWKITNGKVQFGYDGFASNSNGWWRIEDGMVNFSCNDILPGTINGEDGWWHVVRGCVTFDTTVAENANGWWRIADGKVDFTCNSVESNANGWWYIRNGQVDFSYNGFASNANGWWKIEGGCVNFGCNDVAPGTVNGQNGWWHVVGGCVIFDTTVAANANGWWYIRDGQVDFSYYGLAQNGNGWWYIFAGQVDFGYNGYTNYNGNWYHIVGGQVRF